MWLTSFHFAKKECAEWFLNVRSEGERKDSSHIRVFSFCLSETFCLDSLSLWHVGYLAQRVDGMRSSRFEELMERG